MNCCFYTSLPGAQKLTYIFVISELITVLTFCHIFLLSVFSYKFLIQFMLGQDILSYEKIDYSNIHQFKQQNSLLFPVIYPDSFYRNIINSHDTTALLGKN